jgi:hypothetical protein
MDEEVKLLRQIGELQKAQRAVKSRNPPDIDTFRQLASLISDLNFRLLTLVGQPVIPPLSPADVQSLQAAIDALDRAVTQSAGASQILQAATALANG